MIFQLRILLLIYFMDDKNYGVVVITSFKNGDRQSLQGIKSHGAQFIVCTSDELTEGRGMVCEDCQFG